MNLFAARPASDPARVAQIKEWVREALAVPDDTTVMVTELQCTEPGCPPLETVIAILDGGGAPPRQYKLHTALAQITPVEIAALATRGGPSLHQPSAT